MSDSNPSSSESRDSRAEAELIGRIIQSEQKLSDYFTTIITKSVTDQMEVRNLFRLKLFGLVLVIFMTVAIPGIATWIRGSIEGQTKVALDSKFNDATERLEQQFQIFLDKERMYSSFTNYLLYLSDRANVSQSELTTVRLRLEEILKNPQVIERPEFPYLLDIVARLAIEHHDRITLDLLESKFETILASSHTAARLARYHGERVLSDHFSSEGTRRNAARRFRFYMDSAELSADFTALLPLQLMVDGEVTADYSGDKNTSTEAHVRNLGPKDQAVFIAETVRYSNPQFWEAPTTARTRRIAVIAGSTVIDHRGVYIDLLDSVAVQTDLVNIAESAANRGNFLFASALSGFRNAFSGELASADDATFRASIIKLIESDIGIWAQDDLILDTLRQQNLETETFNQRQIDGLEEQWHAEFESGAYDLIETVQERPVSRLLRRLKRDSVGMYREIYVMDGVGLLVGASDPNSDYWQGEEDKWLKTFKVGADAMHIGPLKFDDSALAWVVQISLPLIDPATRKPIGAITIGVDPSLLEHSM